MQDSSSFNFFDLPPERRWHQQLSPAPVVVAIVRRSLGPNSGSSRFLLIKRNADPYKGSWALVGGKWEFGETLHEAIIREVKEETNLDASFTAVRGVVSERIVPAESDENGAHFLLFVCELIANHGQAEEQGEGEIAWFTRSEIEHLYDADSIIPSDFAMINSFAESNKAVPHIEAEMVAPVRGTRSDAHQLLRFELINNLKSGNET